MSVTRTMSKLLLSAAVVLPLVVVGATATRASASPAPITVAYITDLTGQGASQNGTSASGFQARIALQNAEGGVNGHKLVAPGDRRPDGSLGDLDRGAERHLQGLRDRLPESAVLPGGQVPPATRSPGDRDL